MEKRESQPPVGQSASLLDVLAFDLGKVLVNFDHARALQGFSKFCDRDPLEIAERFKASGLGELFDEGKIPSQEFANRVMEILGKKFDFGTFESIWNGIFWENPGMEKLLRQLKGKYLLYGVSDTNELHFRYLQEHFPILHWLDGFVLSYEIGVRKPSPKFFEEIVRRTGRKRDRILLIDDRPEVVEGAIIFGFYVVRFQSLEQLKNCLGQWRIEVEIEGPKITSSS